MLASGLGVLVDLWLPVELEVVVAALHRSADDEARSPVGEDADAAAAYAYLNEEYVEDWTVSQVTPPSLSGLPPDEVNGGGGWSGIMGGPPPKLVPISGKLEMVRRCPLNHFYLVSVGNV